MTQQTRFDLKCIVVIIGSVIGIFGTIVGLTVKVTTRFNANDSDHMVIKSTLVSEVNRSMDNNHQASLNIEKLAVKVDEVSNKQIKVVTNQERIIQDIATLSRKIDKDSN